MEANSNTVEGLRAQLYDDAVTMLALWVSNEPYNQEDEQLVKTWAQFCQVPDEDVFKKIVQIQEGKLQKPGDRLAALQSQPGSAKGAPKPSPFAAAAGGAAAAGAGDGGLAPSGADHHSHKRPAANGTDAAHKKQKQLVPVVAPDADGYYHADGPFANIGDAVGQKVKRYWIADATKNKGDPWFQAVVTDFNPLTGNHVLTYSFGTQKEEKEEVNLCFLKEDQLQLMNETIDLDKWYEDPKRRKKSAAVEKSAWLRQRFQERQAAAGGGGGGAGGVARGKSAKGPRQAGSAMSGGSVGYR